MVYAGRQFYRWGIWRTGIKINGDKLPLGDKKIAEIQSIEKTLRLDPETYLLKDYVKAHAKSFENGASRIVSRNSYEDYGIGKPDAGKTEFVLTKERAREMISESKGDFGAIADKLGIPKEQLIDDSLVLVEFELTQLSSPRIPTGNEWCANSQWIPDGKLPKGDLEAVVRTEGMVNGRDYTVTDLLTGEEL